MVKNKEIKDLTFVQSNIYKEIGSFGIVLCHNDETKIAYIGSADMDESFGTWETSYESLDILSEKEIKIKLAIISENKEKFPYFIIQLNDIPELSQYHIEENEFIKKIRRTNDVCIYLKEEVNKK